MVDVRKKPVKHISLLAQTHCPAFYNMWRNQAVPWISVSIITVIFPSPTDPIRQCLHTSMT